MIPTANLAAAAVPHVSVVIVEPFVPLLGVAVDVAPGAQDSTLGQFSYTSLLPPRPDVVSYLGACVDMVKVEVFG